MNISLIDVDNTKYPNLALMKLSAFHKSNGDNVHWHCALGYKTYDKIYSSQVFTFSKNEYAHGDIEMGGSGVDINKNLPDEIEHVCPDYDLYGIDYSMGFLTRGCIRKCSFCIVHKKEGYIKPHADILEFLRHGKVCLMDNNVLASDHGIKQIEKIKSLRIKIDFNQGLDARLIDDKIAKLLSGVKWWYPIRLACDSNEQIEQLQKAVTLLRWHNATPRRYFVYCIIKDPNEALERIKFLKGLDLDIHAQPYLDRNGAKPTKIQKDIARWVNHKAIFKSVTWDNYNK